jgi:putative flippase GtrA
MSTRGEVIRFLAGGASTTLVSYAVYLLLLPWLPYLVAYGVSYAVGIVWSYFISVRFVFGGQWSWSGLFKFPIVYLVQLLIGALTVWIAVDKIGLPAAVAPLLAIVVSLPITFLLSRRLIRGAAPADGAANR